MLDSAGLFSACNLQPHCGHCSRPTSHLHAFSLSRQAQANAAVGCLARIPLMPLRLPLTASDHPATTPPEPDAFSSAALAAPAASRRPFTQAPSPLGVSAPEPAAGAAAAAAAGLGALPAGHRAAHVCLCGRVGPDWQLHAARAGLPPPCAPTWQPLQG